MGTADHLMLLRLLLLLLLLLFIMLMLLLFLGSGPEGADDLCLISFGDLGWDLGLKAGIWASRLEFWPLGWVFDLKTGF